MKPRHTQICIAAATVAAVGAWLWLSLALRQKGGLDMVPNIAAIGMSPYGKTLALAVQSPIDAYWHAGEQHDHDSDHDEDHCPECARHREEEAREAEEASHGPVMARAKLFVEGLTHCAEARTNPHGQTEAHKRYLRRQVENKLSVAYWLDPTNYANYNCYHLFLTESALGTREHKIEDVIQLCDDTRSIVEREKVNPEPWLTAASADINKMEMVFLHRDSLPDPRESMARAITDMEFCLGRYQFLRDREAAAGTWNQIAEPRREVMEQRFRMLGRLLEAQKVILKERLTEKTNGGLQG